MSIPIPDDTTFEQAQRELNVRVTQLESGEVGLDDAVRIFEEAMAYQRFCEGRLSEIKGRIEELTAGDLPAAGAATPDDAGPGEEPEPPF